MQKLDKRDTYTPFRAAPADRSVAGQLKRNTVKEVKGFKRCNYSPPTAKFIINEIIFYIAMVANKIFRLMDGEHNAHTKP